jgi:ATP-dependent Clp protease protease subunit
MPKLYIYGTVGYDIDADYVRLALDDIVGELEVRINSGGGDVFEGNSIYSLLKYWNAQDGNNLTIYVDGLAASIASVIAMAADEIYMSNNSLMMIHNPWIPSAAGDAEDLRETANILDKVRDTLITVYEDRTGLDRDTISELMNEETWLTAKEAVTFGFADSIVNGSEMPTASIKNFAYANAPQFLLDETRQLVHSDKPLVPMSLQKAKVAYSRCCNKQA